MIALFAQSHNYYILYPWTNFARKLRSSALPSDSYRTVFDLRAKQEEIITLEAETEHPNFWDNPKRAAEVTQKIFELKESALAWGEIQSDIASLGELAEMARGGNDQKEIERRCEELTKVFELLKGNVFFSGPYDKGEAVLTIIAGAGGDDAEDWARILLEMYTRYAAKKKWSVAVLHQHKNETGGIKNATIELGGKDAYGTLKHETGVHRLVRISPFDAGKRRHTSFALVEVMPKFVDPGEIEIDEKDLEYNFARSSGAGGQNVNKRETAVRITHIPTGVTVHISEERSQERNRSRALELLRAKLYNLKLKSRKEEKDALKTAKAGEIEWGHQIRSYVLHPYKMVKDHRTGAETGRIDAVFSGELDEFIESELKLN